MPNMQYIILAYNRLATTGHTAFITIIITLKSKDRSQLYFTEHTQDASPYTLVYCYRLITTQPVRITTGKAK